MSIIKRKSCRAIILTPQNEILLIKIENPEGCWTGWITPGGGIDDGEREEAALARELQEELGFSAIHLECSQKIWIRYHSFPWHGNTVQQSESFYLIHSDKFEPSPGANVDDAANLNTFRWWTMRELIHSNENFAPQEIHMHLQNLLKNGPPSRVVDVGI